MISLQMKRTRKIIKTSMYSRGLKIKYKILLIISKRMLTIIIIIIIITTTTLITTALTATNTKNMYDTTA